MPNVSKIYVLFQKGRQRKLFSFCPMSMLWDSKRQKLTNLLQTVVSTVSIVVTIILVVSVVVIIIVVVDVILIVITIVVTGCNF